MSTRIKCFFSCTFFIRQPRILKKVFFHQFLIDQFQKFLLCRHNSWFFLLSLFRFFNVIVHSTVVDVVILFCFFWGKKLKKTLIWTHTEAVPFKSEEDKNEHPPPRPRSNIQNLLLSEMVFVGMFAPAKCFPWGLKRRESKDERENERERERVTRVRDFECYQRWNSALL